MAQRLLANYQPGEARRKRRRSTDQHKTEGRGRWSTPGGWSVISLQISREERQRENGEE